VAKVCVKRGLSADFVVGFRKDEEQCRKLVGVGKCVDVGELYINLVTSAFTLS